MCVCVCARMGVEWCVHSLVNSHTSTHTHFHTHTHTPTHTLPRSLTRIHSHTHTHSLAFIRLHNGSTLHLCSAGLHQARLDAPSCLFHRATTSFLTHLFVHVSLFMSPPPVNLQEQKALLLSLLFKHKLTPVLSFQIKPPIALVQVSTCPNPLTSDSKK